MRLDDKIVELLASRNNDIFRIPQIAELINGNKRSISVRLTHLVKTQRVHRISVGLYQHPSGLVKELIDPHIRFHGIKFEYRHLKMMRWSYLDLQKIVNEQLRSPIMHRHPKNKSITTSTDWEGRSITVTIHPEKVGLLEVWNRSSLLPLHPLEFGQYCGYIQGVFKIPSDFWTLKQLGINIDHENVQLDGWTNISMKVAQNNVLRMYQKAKDLRIEAHITTDMTAKECMSYMEGILRYAEILKKK